MTRTLRELPGFVTVTGASERLHLAPRSVRDLIYTGRLPSVRLGRRHYLKTTDIELERRRRLGLPLPPRRTRRQPGRRSISLVPRDPAQRRPTRHVDTSVRRARAAERAALLERWVRAQRHQAEPVLPFQALDVVQPTECGVCGRFVRADGRMVDAQVQADRPAVRQCPTCARRTVLTWADARRREALAARQFASDLRVLAVEAPTAA